RELSTASFTAVNSALRGLSNPSRCRFLAKNSLIEMSRCFAAIVSAVTRRRLWRSAPDPAKAPLLIEPASLGFCTCALSSIPSGFTLVFTRDNSGLLQLDCGLDRLRPALHQK